MTEAVERRWSRLFYNSAFHFHGFERGAQLPDFVALCAAGHGLFKRLALPMAQQSGRNILGTGHVASLSTSGHLSYARRLKGRGVLLAGGR